MDVSIKIGNTTLAQLCENVGGYKGLDLYVFDTHNIDSIELLANSKRARTDDTDDSPVLEARLVYSPHRKCEEGRRLTENLVTGLTKQAFVTVDYIKSLKDYKKVIDTEHGKMMLDTKRDQMQGVRTLWSVLYAKDSNNLVFRYSPGRTRLYRLGAAALAGFAGLAWYNGTGLLDAGIAGHVLHSVELAVLGALAYCSASTVTKYCLPFFMSPKAMLVDIQNRKRKAEDCGSKLKESSELLEKQGEKMSLRDYERCVAKKKRQEEKGKEICLQLNSMLHVLSDIHKAVGNIEGLHLTYRTSEIRSVEELVKLMTSMVPAKKKA